MCTPKEYSFKKEENNGAQADTAIPRQVPRGLEVLIKKAAVDPAFKDILIEKRAGAAEAIGLKLTAAEEAMLAAIPFAHLEGIIAHTRVNPKLKPVFLGYAAGAMLAALGGTLLISGLLDSESINDRNNDTLRRNRVVRVKTSSKSESNFVDDNGPNPDNAVYGYSWGLGASGGVRPGELRRRKAKITRVSIPSPTSVGGTAAADANRSPGAIAAVVQRHLAGFENAYNSALKKNPDLGSGKITLRFTISPAGEVTYAEIIQDTLGAAAVNDAVLSRAKSWRFPRTGGEDVVVIYPFVFAPS